MNQKDFEMYLMHVSALLNELRVAASFHHSKGNVDLANHRYAQAEGVKLCIDAFDICMGDVRRETDECIRAALARAEKKPIDNPEPVPSK